MRAQPSVLEMMKKRLRSAVKQYNDAVAKLNSIKDEESEAYYKAYDRERLLRGVVRGSAQMYICLANPAEANRKESINDLEIDYGMPGKRSRPRATASDTVSKFLSEYYEG